jgi:hypothetical protein
MGRTGCFVLALVVAAILAATAVALLVLLGRGSEPTTVEDAVEAFRTELGGSAPVESPVPEGVYVYATDGYEKTDALTGITNRYPTRTTITVVRDDCGFRMRWDATQGRSTTWTVCRGPDGWTLASQDERHTFFGRTERTTYACVDTPLVPAGGESGTPARFRCSTGSAEERGSSRVTGRRSVRVAGRDVEVVEVRRVTTLTGASRGATRYDAWLDRSGLPVQLVMRTQTVNDAPVGEVRYEEDVSLRLESLEPER